MLYRFDKYTFSVKPYYKYFLTVYSLNSNHIFQIIFLQYTAKEKVLSQSSAKQAQIESGLNSKE